MEMIVGLVNNNVVLLLTCTDLLPYFLAPLIL